MTEAVINLLRKSVDWFLYDNGLRHERVNSSQKKFLAFLSSQLKFHFDGKQTFISFNIF